MKATPRKGTVVYTLITKAHAKAVRKSKCRATDRPSDGSFVSLVCEDMVGYHIQVEWVHDTRFNPKPWIVAYAWGPRGRSYIYHG